MFAAWDESTDAWTAWIQYTLWAGGHCVAAKGVKHAAPYINERAG